MGASPQRVTMDIKCSIEGELQKVLLIFSSDNGKQWYEIEMLKQGPIYSISIPSLVVGTRILYVFKGMGKNGEEFMEDNQGHFYSQIATLPLEAEKVQNTPTDAKLEQSPMKPPSLDIDNQGSLQRKHLLPPKVELGVGEEIIPKAEPSHIEEPIAKNIPNDALSQDNRLKILERPTVREIPKTVVPPTPKVEEVKESGRPITCYNPYTIQDGEIGAPPTIAETFSRIMGAKRVAIPEKKQSFVNKPQIEDSKSCVQCKAILNLTWKICPICGAKAK
jgi:hypothetical protein